MKTLYTIILGLLVLSASCSHDKIVVDGDQIKWKDSSYTAAVETPQARNLLVEVQTGVQSARVPEAFDTISKIIKRFPNRVSVAALHGDISLFNQPFFGLSKYDFRSNKAEQICYTYAANRYPSAMISREGYFNNTYFDTSIAGWSSRIEGLLAIKQDINLHLSSEYNSQTNLCELLVKIACTQDITDQLYLSVYIVENDLKDYQQDGTNKNPSFVHNYVFRDRVTDLRGDALEIVDRKGGFVLQKRASFKPNTSGPQAWNLDNCKIIAFVNYNYSLNKAVVHCQEVDLK